MRENFLKLGLLLTIFCFLAACIPATAEEFITEDVVEEPMLVQSEIIAQSIIEKNFFDEDQLTLSDENQLTQIGYDIFKKHSTNGNGKYAADYNLNIGEKINVYFWGDSVDVISMAGSSIISPLGEVLAGPLYGEEGILYADLDLGEIARGKFDFDVVGHYSRPDVFKLIVNERPAKSISFKNE